MSVQIEAGFKVMLDVIAAAETRQAAAVTYPRQVIEARTSDVDGSRRPGLPHSPGIRVGKYIFLSGMGPVDPVSGGRNLGPIAEQIRQTLRNMAHMLECSLTPATTTR
jgi:enamine deaminase RidA (YjgF/YER057c/UK114 family)